MIEAVEEGRRAWPGLGDSVKPPPQQAQDPVPIAIGLSRAVAHEDEPRRWGSGDGGSLVVLLVPACTGSCSPAGRRRGEVRDRSPWWKTGELDWGQGVGGGFFNQQKRQQQD
jgi:hypothetical protein